MTKINYEQEINKHTFNSSPQLGYPPRLHSNLRLKDIEKINSSDKITVLDSFERMGASNLAYNCLLRYPSERFVLFHLFNIYDLHKAKSLDSLRKYNLNNWIVDNDGDFVRSKGKNPTLKEIIEDGCYGENIPIFVEEFEYGISLYCPREQTRIINYLAELSKTHKIILRTQTEGPVLAERIPNSELYPLGSIDLEGIKLILEERTQDSKVKFNDTFAEAASRIIISPQELSVICEKIGFGISWKFSEGEGKYPLTTEIGKKHLEFYVKHLDMQAVSDLKYGWWEGKLGKFKQDENSHLMHTNFTLEQLFKPSDLEYLEKLGMVHKVDGIYQFKSNLFRRALWRIDEKQIKNIIKQG